MKPVSLARRLKARLDVAPSSHARLRNLTLAACGCLLVVAVLPYVPPLAPERWPYSWRMILITIVATAESALFLMAARRSALGRRLQQAMGLFAAALLLVAVSDSLVVLMDLPTNGPALSRINDVLELGYSCLGLIALFWMPLAPLRRHGRWLVAVDIAMAVGGMTLVLFVTTTLVELSAAHPSEYSRIVQYGVMTAGNLVALNLILVRGLARPVRGAIWFLAATVVLEIGYWVIVQLKLAGLRSDMRLLDLVFAVDQVCYTLAALSFLTSPVDRDDRSLTPDWMRAINPLPALAVTAVGGLLVQRVLLGSTTNLVLLSIGMVALSLLLVARVLLAAHDRALLVREETELAHRLQHDRVMALRRVAGGIAHEFNNLMTVVIGATDMGQDEVTPGSEPWKEFARIREASGRAADLTDRLLTYAGGAPGRRRHLVLAEMLRALEPRLREVAGPRVDVVLDLDATVPVVVADRDLIERAVMQLAANARAAMPSGGRMSVRLRDQEIGDSDLAGAVLPAPRGRYAVIQVSDTGVGIEPANLQRIFDPFYSSQSLAVAPGLGLAVVHGAIASHEGGIGAASEPGRGTTIRLYLPAADEPCP